MIKSITITDFLLTLLGANYTEMGLFLKLELH